MAAILIVEDEPVFAHQLAVALRSGGHEATVAGTVQEALEAVALEAPDLALVDLRLPDRSGLELISELKRVDRSVLVVLMTAFGSVRDAVEAMRRGASDYLQKPLDLGEVGLLIDRLVREQWRERELQYLRDRERSAAEMLLGIDPRLRDVMDEVRRLCDPALPPGRRPPILLTGEIGVGKSALGRAIHESLGGGPLIVLPCAASHASGVERELLGFERGSVPGAEGSRAGLFEAAHGGTVVLHEVGALELAFQEKLLEILATHRVSRIGSRRERPVDVHVLATTSRDLEAAAAEGRFLPELLARLGAIRFGIPPLRERPDDLRELASRFAAAFGRVHGGAPRRIAPEAEKRLLAYAWPGNVGELRNLVERAVLLDDAPVLADAALARVLADGSPPGPPGRVLLPEEGVRLEDVERDLLQQALARTGGNQTRASGLLGITRDTLRYRVQKLGLERGRSNRGEARHETFGSGTWTSGEER